MLQGYNILKTYISSQQLLGNRKNADLIQAVTLLSSYL